jgi:hypothetical protein
MAWTFKVETGEGLTDSNSYASVAEADDYHSSRLRSTDWTGASNGDKQKALAQASRTLDAEFRWKGYKRNNSQAMQWPRSFATDRNRSGYLLTPNTAGDSLSEFFPEDVIPKELREATCELARLLIVADRTDPSLQDGSGVNSVEIYQGLKVEFNASDRQKPVPATIAAMLANLGTMISGGGVGTAKLMRK